MQHTAPNDVFSALDSRHRLADISHHFLSEKDEQAAPWRKTRLIPLLMISRNDDFVAYLLEQALKQQGRSCVVLNMEGQGETLAGQDDEADAPEICLLPLTSPGSTLAIPHSKLLMAVPASLPGVRLAYHRLAMLAEQASRLTVHIIMLDARSEKHGERYFSFLRDSAASLLSLQLEEAGVLYRQQDADGESYGGTAQIAQGILRDEGQRNEGKKPAVEFMPGLAGNSPADALGSAG